MGPESKIQKSVVTHAKDRGFVAIKLSSLGMYGTSGWPDYLFLGVKAKIFFIEFKAPGGKTTPLQDERIRLLRALGFRVYVCNDKEQGWSIIHKEEKIVEVKP